MPIVVLHRERSERLAREFAAALHEQGDEYEPWPDIPPAVQETIISAFDSLIQDGLICEEQHRPQGRQ